MLSWSRSALAHVSSCDSCRGKGFYCEMCSGPELLFPFSARTVVCHACASRFHTACAQQRRLNEANFYTAAEGNLGCPKCQRKLHRLRTKD